MIEVIQSILEWITRNQVLLILIAAGPAILAGTKILKQ